MGDAMNDRDGSERGAFTREHEESRHGTGIAMTAVGVAVLALVFAFFIPRVTTWYDHVSAAVYLGLGVAFIFRGIVKLRR